MKLSETTYQKLRNDIFNARYKPNTLITERQIAEKYGVSKLTAGDALHRLCAEGHLTSYPRSGYMVTVLTQQEIQQVKRIRFSIESLVLEDLCQNASDDELRSLRRYIVEHPEKDPNATESNTKFHLAMARMTNNHFLVKFTQDLLGTLSRNEHQISAYYLAHWQDYHEEIVKSLLAGNLDKAKEWLAKDIDQIHD